jgi:hypothetical protein
MIKTQFINIGLSMALLFFAASPADAQTFEAKMHSISYFSKSAGCSSTETILVRVKYSVSSHSPNELVIAHQYANGVQISANVEKIDKKGNIVYDFCIDKNHKEEIYTTFKTENGDMSNKIKIIINAPQANIVSGTPPKTLRL